jgi:hypothetical protein
VHAGRWLSLELLNYGAKPIVDLSTSVANLFSWIALSVSRQLRAKSTSYLASRFFLLICGMIYCGLGNGGGVSSLLKSELLCFGGGVTRELLSYFIWG